MDQNRFKKANFVYRLIEGHENKLQTKDVLEVGCFTGKFGEALSHKFRSWTGIDIDEQAIQRCQESENRKYSVMNAENLKFEEATFDLIICNHIYEHVPNPEKMLSELWRVLRPGGLIYFSAGNKFQLIEPHHRIPLLSWVPKKIANLILSLKKKSKVIYYENLFSRRDIYQLLSSYPKEEITIEAICMLLRDTNFGSKFIIKKFVGFFFPIFRIFLPTYIFVLNKPNE